MEEKKILTMTQSVALFDVNERVRFVKLRSYDNNLRFEGFKNKDDNTYHECRIMKLNGSLLITTIYNDGSIETKTKYIDQRGKVLDDIIEVYDDHIPTSISYKKLLEMIIYHDDEAYYNDELTDRILECHGGNILQLIFYLNNLGIEVTNLPDYSETIEHCLIISCDSWSDENHDFDDYYDRLLSIDNNTPDYPFEITFGIKDENLKDFNGYRKIDFEDDNDLSKLAEKIRESLCAFPRYGGSSYLKHKVTIHIDDIGRTDLDWALLEQKIENLVNKKRE